MSASFMRRTPGATSEEELDRCVSAARKGGNPAAASGQIVIVSPPFAKATRATPEPRHFRFPQKQMTLDLGHESSAAFAQQNISDKTLFFRRAECRAAFR
ncbi:MAG: hypothetical protein D6741_08520, partial [Planctomycetota bacterium]